ncbi:MAG: hypothetical protein KDC27_02945, partial [Acidobacteria bacterium]|nr:hypothetical protein [Acidobacteriota bacterium]
GLPAGPFDLVAGVPVVIDLQILMTPDEAGKTIGGTIHVYLAGKNLAKPLAVSLQQTASEGGEDPPPGTEPDPEEEGGSSGGNSGFIQWSDSIGPVDALTLSVLQANSGQLIFTPSRDLSNIILWPTPSLRNCIQVDVSPANVPAVGVLELGPNNELLFVAAGTPVMVDVIPLLTPEELGSSPCGGTIHVRNAGKPPRTWPTPLNVRLGAQEESGEEVNPEATVGAASFSLDAVAPGQIVSIFGAGLGPNENAIGAVENNGQVSQSVAGTMVFFDNIAASVLSVKNDQINAVVPYGLTGPDVELLVLRGGYQSTPFPVPLRAAAPELFTLTGTGQGQVAAFNQNGTLNRSTNAAPAPSRVVLFGSGAGATEPPLDAGEIAQSALPLAADVHIFVGDVEATVDYAGTSPGQIAALTQFNITLDAATPPGQQPVKLIVNGIESKQKATLAVR